MSKVTVTVAKTTQSAIPELEQKEKTLYYLVIGEGEGKLIINVGEKTHTQVAKILSKVDQEGQTPGVKPAAKK